MNKSTRNIAGLLIGAVCITAAVVGEQYKSPKVVGSYRDQARRTQQLKAAPARATFEEQQILLTSMRGKDSVCTSADYNCREWTNLALHCERQMNGEITHIHMPCTKAEGLRETVTGVELSTAPGAYSF